MESAYLDENKLAATEFGAANKWRATRVAHFTPVHLAGLDWTSLDFTSLVVLQLRSPVASHRIQFTVSRSTFRRAG